MSSYSYNSTTGDPPLFLRTSRQQPTRIESGRKEASPMTYETRAYETITVQKLTGGCGAEVLGIDLAKDLGNRQWDELRQVFLDNGVIFFRDQQLTPEQHIAFARRWGPIDVNKFFVPAPGYPEIAEVRKEKEQKSNIGGGWHTDHSYDAEPAMGSILLARDVPDEGGDTLFSNMY